jgi:hypothetical protein
MTNKGGMLIVLILISLTACTENRLPELGKTIEGRSDVRTFRIVFGLSGDDIGSPESREIMGKMMDAIIQSEAGGIVRSGYGMGSMEIILRTSVEQPREELNRIILSEFPKAWYRIEELQEESRIK